MELKGGEIMHFYITKYRDGNGVRKAVSWLQINLFRWNICLFKRYMDI